MIQLVPSTVNLDFLGKRKICIGFSVVLIFSMIILLALRGLNWGIDFSGGTLLQLKTSPNTEISLMRSALNDMGEKGFSIQGFEQGSDEYLVRLPNKQGQTADDVSERVLNALIPIVGEVEVRRVEFVGPQVGGELREKGLLGLLFSMLAILVYISIRFEMRYAFGAVAALLHDVFIIIGVFSLLQKEVTMPVLAALLTVIGYSLNDTIVVFDRVRENLKRGIGKTIEETLNISVNDMLNRTLMTSITTLLVLLALFFLGGGVIHDFAFTLLMGVIVGTYSSIFVASPVVLAMEGYYQRMKAEEEAEQHGFISKEKEK